MLPLVRASKAATGKGVKGPSAATGKGVKEPSAATGEGVKGCHWQGCQGT